MTLKDSYHDVISKIDDHVTLIAVSKTKPMHMIQDLYELGQKDFGENYVQELVSKADYLETKSISDIRWHFIGHLQSNKVKTLLPYLDVLHTLDRKSLLEELIKRKEFFKSKKLDVFMQVNIDEEESKSGVLPKKAKALWAEICSFDELNPLGLMCIPDPNQKDSYLKLVALSKEIDSDFNWKFSMGMSGDYEKAISQGATHVRVGSLLFGARS